MRNLVVSKNKFIKGIISIVFMVIFLIFNNIYVDKGNSVTWSATITPFILILLTTDLIILKNILPRRRTLLYAVIICFFVFHFSHVILQGMYYEFGTNTRNNIFFRQEIHIIFEATHVQITAITGMMIGIILYYIFYREKAVLIDSKLLGVDSKALCALFIIVGFIADILNSGQAIVSLFIGGYANVQESISSVFYGFRLLSYLLLPGILIYIQDRNKSAKKRRLILIIFMIYKTIMMLSGLRAYGLINILLAMYVYYRNEVNQKIRIKHVVLALVALQFGGGLIIGVREARTAGMDIRIICDNMFDVKSNILFNMMSEFGITQNVICEVLSAKNGIGNNGMQLLYSFLIIIPGISKIAPNLNYSAAFLEDSLQIHNYGGSYVADILFDFGTNGILPGCVILGVFFAMLYELFERNLQANNIKCVAVLAPIIVDFIFCVRSSMAKMPRMVCWYLIIVLFLTVIANMKGSEVRDNVEK